MLRFQDLMLSVVAMWATTMPSSDVTYTGLDTLSNNITKTQGNCSPINKYAKQGMSNNLHIVHMPFFIKPEKQFRY